MTRSTPSRKTRTLPCLAALCGLALTHASLAQAPQLLRAATTLDDPFTVPIHTAPADGGLEYGIWASGPRYKVSFHDGMAFLPVLGASYPENLPFRWHTTEVKIGSREISIASTGVRRRDWRYEYLTERFTEAYDVRPDGVEQTFTFADRPTVSGDLVITGRIDSKLEGQPVSGVHGSIEFCDQRGRAIVSYGAATVVDAAGDTMPIETTYTGGSISLRVPGDWLSTATYPITVDPLLRTMTLGGLAKGHSESARVARDDRNNDQMVMYARLVSASDFDCYARLTDDGFGNPVTVHAEITSAWSSPGGDVSYVYGADQWLFALQRDNPRQGFSTVRWKLHAGGDRSFQQVGALSVAGATNYQAQGPVVGGCTSFSDKRGLIVYQVDRAQAMRGQSTRTEIWGATVDCSTRVLGTPFRIGSTSSDLDSQKPSVNAQRGPAEPWVVAFQQFNNSRAGDDWDICVAKINPDGTASQQRFAGDTLPNHHSLAPHVDGRHGKYMLAYVRRTNINRYHGYNGPEVFAQAFDWSSTSSSPSLSPFQLVGSSAHLLMGGVAFDNVTRSHWSIIYQESQPDEIYVARVGFNGKVAESVAVSNGTGNNTWPAIAFDDDHHRYSMVWCADGLLKGREFTYPTVPGPVRYGVACTPAEIGARGMGHAYKAHSGSDNFGVRLTNGDPHSVVVLLLGLRKAGISLDPVGMPGCALNLDPGAILLSVAASTGSGTTATVMVPIPAPLRATVYFQWAVFKHQANALDLLSTKGLEVGIR